MLLGPAVASACQPQAASCHLLCYGQQCGGVQQHLHAALALHHGCQEEALAATAARKALTLSYTGCLVCHTACIRYQTFSLPISALKCTTLQVANPSVVFMDEPTSGALP